MPGSARHPSGGVDSFLRRDASNEKYVEFPDPGPAHPELGGQCECANHHRRVLRERCRRQRPGPAGCDGNHPAGGDRRDPQHRHERGRRLQLRGRPAGTVHGADRAARLRDLRADRRPVGDQPAVQRGHGGAVDRRPGGDRPGHRAAHRRNDQLGSLGADHRGDDRRHHRPRARRHVDAADPARRRLPARPGRDRRDRHRLVAAQRRRHPPGLEHRHHRRDPGQRHRPAGGLQPLDEPGCGRRGERPAHQLHRGHRTQRRRADQPRHQGRDQ